MASEFLLVARQVLERHGQPLSARDIVHIAIREGLFNDKRAGKTPHQTMKAKLSVDIRRRGASSAFVRTAPGRFFLRNLLGDETDLYHAPPARPPRPIEEVLLFHSSWLRKETRFQGVRRRGARALLKRLVASGELRYMARHDAEQRDDLKQIITYVMVTRGSQVLSYRRGNYNRVEDFLKGARCVGFGGHVTGADLSLFDQSMHGIKEAAARELKEELALPTRDRLRLESHSGLEVIGLLNDDASPTGRRHFAVVLRFEVSSDSGWAQPARNEKAITQLEWLDPEASPHRLFEFEYWSQLCLTAFYGSAKITRPTYVIRRKLPFRPPHVLLVTGELGSGKTATTKLLKRAYSYSEVNSGAVLAGLLGLTRLNSEAERLAFQDRAWQFISAENGPSLLAEELWRRVNVEATGRVLIEGIRQRATIDAFRRAAGSRRVGIVFIHTPFNMAFEFYRSRSGSTPSVEDFIEARSKPVEREVPGLVELADGVLYNWHGERELEQMLHGFMTDLGVSP